LGIPVIFTGARGVFDKLPKWDQCIYGDFIDFAHVLPQCRMIVHHGGMGTIAQALRAGIPQIVRPVVFDQPDNAKRLKALGIADYILPEDFTAQRLIEAIRQAEQNHLRSTRMEKYRQDVQGSMAIKDACNLIEQSLLETCSPVGLKCA